LKLLPTYHSNIIFTPG